MASLDTFLIVQNVLMYGRMFQGSDEVKKPLLYDSESNLLLSDLFILGRLFRNFLLLQWSRYR